MTELLERLRELEAERDQLFERQQEHLRLIRRLTIESVSATEAAELRGQIAALIAEVGTLRAQLQATSPEGQTPADWSGGRPNRASGAEGK